MSVDASGEVVASSTVETVLTPAIFEETQFFHPVVYLVLFASAALEGLILGALALRADDTGAGNLLIIGLVGIVNCFLLNLLVLRTRVDASEIFLALGFFPIFRTRIPLAAITNLRVVTYRPFRDAGGWGIRFGRFEDNPCRFWNARGGEGVLVETRERKYIIGSQRAEELYLVLKDGSKN